MLLLATAYSDVSIRWGILHTEKFWKENAKFADADNFSLLKTLIVLAQSPDEVGTFLLVCRDMRI